MNKYVLVTSSTRGIGKAIGKMFLEKGYFVFFNYFNNEKDVNSLEKEIVQYNGNYLIIRADMSQLTGIDVVYKEIFKITNKLDVLVLNTAITDKTEFNNITFNNWNNVINTNLNIPFFLIQKLSNLIKNNGSIIFIGALMGIIPHSISISYAVSKAGLHMLAKSLVKVFKDRNITVNVIAPGFIETPWQNNKTKKHRKRIENKIALNRFGTSDEIAKLCISIVKNDYINGSIINIDGGYDMGE